MKSAGSVYDELTPTKAITRIGAVDLGSLTWYYTGGLFRATISDGAYTGNITGSATVTIIWSEESSVNQDSPRSSIIKVEDFTYSNFVDKVLEKFNEVTGKVFRQNKKFYVACLNIRLKVEI
jgi:hypothetical protein